MKERENESSRSADCGIYHLSRTPTTSFLSFFSPSTSSFPSFAFSLLLLFTCCFSHWLVQSLLICLFRIALIN